MVGYYESEEKLLLEERKGFSIQKGESGLTGDGNHLGKKSIARFHLCHFHLQLSLNRSYLYPEGW